MSYSPWTFLWSMQKPAMVRLKPPEGARPDSQGAARQGLSPGHCFGWCVESKKTTRKKTQKLAAKEVLENICQIIKKNSREKE